MTLEEMLEAEVVLPAKARVARGEKNVTLISSNHRFLGPDQRSTWQWIEEFGSKEELEKILRELVKKHFGHAAGIRFERFSGYLGVTSNTSYKLVLPS